MSQYTNWDFISLVSKYGNAFEERDHGQLFCLDSAKEIVDMLLSECDQPNVEQRDQVEISAGGHTEHGFTLQTTIGETECAALVVATG
ncbi:NAD(P)/FAD-dependent oxidoreductase, partial [Proteus faecis]|uniref:NAD(P)/FAD-dependent oxidoreductase n=1 Tax=Proteus faecis TaxID=2050967 RepID=UPI003B01BEC7